MFQDETKFNFKWMIGVTVLVMLFQNCSQISVTDLVPKTDPLALATPLNPGEEPPTTEPPVPIEPPSNTPPPIEEVLKTMKPTLAVRGISCLMCHAEIRSSIITDFGYGTENYMGGTKHFDKEESWFNNLAGTWQSARKIEGSVIVPNAKVTAQAQARLGATYQDQPLVSIVELMNTKMTVDRVDHVTAEEAQLEMATKIIPAEGQERVLAKSRILISAPSVQDIKDLAPQLWSNPSQSGGSYRIGSLAEIQLHQVISNSKSYTTNDEDVVLECSKSDIVVRGTLLLRKLKVHAAGGCRLYVTGTVFIEDAINYVGEGDNQNLQITSSSAIVMGIGKDRLYHRLKEDARGLTLVSRNYGELADQVVAEANLIGNLKDARDDYNPAAAIDFAAVLLNAPIVHSRYLGRVSGTIIAEAALLSLGKFHFIYDDVFSKVDVLPQLKKPILIAD